MSTGSSSAWFLEAKPQGTTLSEVEPQTKKYVTGVPDAMPAPLTPLPFGYEATGAETQFTNFYDPEPRARRVFSFFPPETLALWLQEIQEKPAQEGTFRTRLHTLPVLDQGRLWDVQAVAIRNMEKYLERRQSAGNRVKTMSGGSPRFAR